MAVRTIIQYQIKADVVLPPRVNPAVNEAPYHQPWSIPRWDGVLNQNRIALTVSGNTFPAQQAGEIVTVSKWFAPLSEPIVKDKKSLGSGLQQFSAYSESAQFPETVNEAKFHQPWSLPVWYKTDPRLAVALIVSGSFAPILATNQFPGLSEAMFHQPWSTPVWDKPRLSTGLQKADFLVKAAPFQETVMESKFHQPLSEPIVKQKIGLNTGSQQYLAFVAAKFGEPISYDKYSYAWSEPIWLDLRASRLKTHLQSFGTNDPYWGIRKPTAQGYVIA